MNVYFKYLLILVLLFTNVLTATDVEYSWAISNSSPSKNEAVFLDVNISQNDHSKVMLFKFNLKKSDSYDFFQIAFKEQDTYHDLKHQYRYVIYAKKEGNVSLEFNMIKSLTDDDKVAYAISGDRDNVKSLVKKDIVEHIEAKFLRVKALDKYTDLVGDFKLTYSLDKTTTDAYEPIHLIVTLKGKGLLNSFEILEKNEAYNLFKQAPKVESFHSLNGTNSSIVWNYAISGKEDFTLPQVLLNIFNPKTKKNYKLLIPSQQIMVNKIDKKTLLDKEDYPPSKDSLNWEWLGWIASYFLVFIAGYLMPRNLFKRKNNKTQTVEEMFSEKVKKVKTHKELLLLLLAQNNVMHKEAIEQLEAVVYKKKKISLSQILDLIDTKEAS